MNIEEAIKLLEEFKKNGYSALYIKYGDRNKTNLKIEKAIETLTNYVETMHKELDRLEGIEDNTAMLKQELKEQKEANKELNKVLIHFKAVINEMAKWIHNNGTDETEICDYEKCAKYITRKKPFGDCYECIKEYFSEKVQK